MPSLVHGDVYIWAVECVDASNITDMNMSVNDTFTFNDNVAPVISNVYNESTNESAFVQWSLGESGNSSVFYGTTESALNSYVGNAGYAMNCMLMEI